jgi:hypothetical protein
LRPKADLLQDFDLIIDKIKIALADCCFRETVHIKNIFDIFVKALDTKLVIKSLD